MNCESNSLHCWPRVLASNTGDIRHRSHRRASKIAYAVPLAAAVSFGVACVIASSRKLFSGDDIFSYYALTDPSFRHMLRGLADTLNATPPVYFGLGWCWTWAFGASDISLRLFSSLGVIVAFTLVWETLRRVYSNVSAGIGTALVFCLSSLIRATRRVTGSM